MDGQQIYLHSLNVRMLEKQYGSLEQSPHILIGNIMEIETGSMTEELRKRLRYLDHLPITCQFQVVEIDLGEPTISTTTRMFFRGELIFSNSYYCKNHQSSFMLVRSFRPIREATQTAPEESERRKKVGETSRNDDS